MDFLCRAKDDMTVGMKEDFDISMVIKDSTTDRGPDNYWCLKIVLEYFFLFLKAVLIWNHNRALRL